VLYDVAPDSGRVYEGGMIECLRSRVLEMNYTESPAPALILVRAAFFAKRFGLRFGPKLQDYVDNQLPKVEPKLDYAQKKYFGDILMPIPALKRVLFAGGVTEASAQER
jgi:hypothetical protein